TARRCASPASVVSASASSAASTSTSAGSFSAPLLPGPKWLWVGEYFGLVPQRRGFATAFVGCGELSPLGPEAILFPKFRGPPGGVPRDRRSARWPRTAGFRAARGAPAVMPRPLRRLHADADAAGDRSRRLQRCHRPPAISQLEVLCRMKAWRMDILAWLCADRARAPSMGRHLR